jgi:hypothetical protein
MIHRAAVFRIEQYAQFSLSMVKWGLISQSFQIRVSPMKILTKFEITSRHADWEQDKLFTERKGDNKSHLAVL